MENKVRLVLPQIFSIYNDPSIATVPSDTWIDQDNFYILINFVTSTDERTLRIEEIIDQSDISP